MTTCPRCGQPLQAPVPACPRCGQRFAPPQQYQANGYNGTADAWSYQPQAQSPQQPPPSPGAGMYGQPAARPGFSVHELVSEEALPDWLRQASAESAQLTQRQPIPGAPGSPAYPPQQGYPPAYPAAYPPANQPPAPGYGGYGGNGNGYSNGYGGYPPAQAPAEEPPAQRPDASAFPSLESAGSYQAPLAGGGGMPASSLLDPNALPTWLGGQQGQAAPDGMRGGEGMRAQSLVDEAALPGWMRNEPASPAQAPIAAPPPPAAPGWGGYPAPSVSPAPSAGAAIPPGGYAGMQMPMPMQQPVQPMQSPAAPVPMNGQPGFSANQLIDPGALPEWMRNQGQAGVPQPGGMPQSPGAAAPAQPGWSASDLIDPSMLPGFVRGNEGPAPTSDNNLARERTSRVPAPPVANQAAERDFGASRAGTAHRDAVSRKHQAARPLGENEKPGWLREEAQGGYGQDDSAAYPSARQGRANNGRNGNGHNGYGDRDGYDGGNDGYNDPYAYEDNGDYGAQNGRNGYRGQPGQPGQQRGRMPEGQTGRSRAARDARDGYGYETARRGRQQPTRQQPAEAPKKRKGGFFGFLRRG